MVVLSGVAASAKLDAAPAASPATASTCAPEAEQTGDFQGEHQEADCNDQKGQAGANESANAHEKADLPEKDGNDQQGNNQD